jgi:hypothetical protein
VRTPISGVVPKLAPHILSCQEFFQKNYANVILREKFMILEENGQNPEVVHIGE